MLKLYQDQFPPATKLRHLTLDWTGARVVDLGANLGALGPYVLERGAVSYHGTEANAVWAAAGNARYAGLAGWTLVQGNAVTASRDCDILCALGLFHHLDDDGVRKVLETTARTIVIEQPMGGPFQSYKMRPSAWYIAALEAAGFVAIQHVAYGFSYPVERAILVGHRA